MRISLNGFTKSRLPDFVNPFSIINNRDDAKNSPMPQKVMAMVVKLAT